MTRSSDDERDRERAARIAAAPYDVGWGKTPVEYRFKKGEKQNFKRRKKPNETVAEIIARLAAEKIRLDLNGVSKIMSAMEISLRKLRKMAIDGNLKALQLWLDIFSQVERAETPETNYDYSAELRRKIEDMAAKHEQNRALFGADYWNRPKAK